jgi:putative nucleotidyltransferase with HDIG domain
MDANKQTVREMGHRPEATRHSHGMAMFTCFAILWTACCLCLLLQTFLRTSYTYLPKEVMEATTPADLIDATASKTVYAERSFPSTVFQSPAESLSRDGKPDTQPPWARKFNPIVPIDTCLIRQDEKYTARTATLLLEYKNVYLNEQRFNLGSFIRSALMFAAILVCFGACLLGLRDDFFARSSRVTLSTLFVFLHMLMLVIAQHIFHIYAFGNSYHLRIFLPMALFPSLGVYLLGIRFGICISMLLSLLTPTLMGGECPYPLFVHAIITSFSGIVIFHNVSKRNGFLLGGFQLVGILLLLSLYFLWQAPANDAWNEWPRLFYTLLHTDEPVQLPYFWIKLLMMALANGFFIMIALFFLPALCERFFDIITPIALHELSSMDHPLLNRLNDEAKGTYNHSVQVGQFAYDAAQAIGVNKLLAKVCGSFHDVGKLRNPEFFIENLIEGQPNPHEGLSPIKSCAKIREHVIYGGELARKYRLQRPIAEAIVSHHGTDVISYFYHKACLEAEAKGEPLPDKKDYSYEGPLPRRKEAVIVEIADICEAASRAELQKWDHIEYAKVRDFVDKLIMNKMKNRQFDEADLTIGELTIVCDVIASSICRLYHGRPQYAKSKDEDDEFQAPRPTIVNGALSSIDLSKDLMPDQPEPAKEQKTQPEPSQEQKTQPEPAKEQKTQPEPAPEPSKEQKTQPEPAPEPSKEQKTQQVSDTPAPPEAQSPKPPSADEH